MTPVWSIVEGDWPDDAPFRQALEQSWTQQYADYLGQSTAQALVARLREDQQLYPLQDLPTQLAISGSQPLGIATRRELQGVSLITMLEVLAPYRGSGIGKALIEALARQSEYRLMAHVSIHRPAVLRFYENLGFQCLQRTTVDHAGHALMFDVVIL